MRIAAGDVGHNTWEVWCLETGGGWFHPIHIHLVDFYVLTRNREEAQVRIGASWHAHSVKPSLPATATNCHLRKLLLTLTWVSSSIPAHTGA